jgi:hypothetical protein
MRLLRGPSFLGACLVAVAAGAAVGAGWLQRAWQAVEPAPHHRPAETSGGVEAMFRRMDEALLNPLASHNPICAGPGGVCTASSERIVNFVSHRRAGSFRGVLFNVGRTANKPAAFALSMDFESGDGRLTLNDQETETLSQIGRDYGFDESQQAAVLAACQEPPSIAGVERTVEAGGISFTCTVLPIRKTIEMKFTGPVPGAFMKQR